MARQHRLLSNSSAWERSYALVAGHVSNAPAWLIARPFAKLVTSTQLGTEFSVTPGQANHSINLQRSFELLPQLQSSARDSRLHRPNADLQRRRDLFITESFDVPQNYCFAIRASQPQKRIAQLSFTFARQRLLFRIGGVNAGQRSCQRLVTLIGSRIDRDGKVALAPAPPPPAIPGLVNRNPVNPGFQASLTAKAGNALKRAQESLLGQVPGLFGVVGQPEEQSVNIGRMFSDQPFEGQRLTAPQSFKELVFCRWADVEGRCRSNRLDVRMPAEGYLLS